MAKPPPDPEPAPKVIKVKKNPNPVVTQVTSTGGTVTDLCASCRHMFSKVVTSATTCACCRGGHN